MTLKIYSVKSNARRDAKKLGVDPLSVEAVEGGFIIGALRQAEQVAPPTVILSEPNAPVEQRGKRARLIAMLREDWQPLPTLERHLGWLPHTVRGAMSVAAKSAGLKIERRRVDGVTSYRAVRPS